MAEAGTHPKGAIVASTGVRRIEDIDKC
jgi:tRNA (guanine-N7-)-methyltransferase